MDSNLKIVLDEIEDVRNDINMLEGDEAANRQLEKQYKKKSDDLHTKIISQLDVLTKLELKLRSVLAGVPSLVEVDAPKRADAMLDQVGREG